MSDRVPTCVWNLTGELVLALDERFGPPVDAYVNGSQVWLREDGPVGITLEWRLHPVAGYQRPQGIGTYDVFEAVSGAIASDGAQGVVGARSLWDGLEAFPAYGDEVEPATLATACTQAIGRAPDASGMADHEAIGDRWEQSGRTVSIVAALIDQLSEPPGGPQDGTGGADY